MAAWVGVAVLIGLSSELGISDAPVGGKPFTDHTQPPSYRLLDEIESAQVSLGEAVFNTHRVGPLFNAASCDECHDYGARGRGPTGDGPAPVALIVQLRLPSADAGAAPAGDPVYGFVFNTAAVEGMKAEGNVTVQYREIEGHYYPDGARWRMRVPHYHLAGLNYGPLAPTTVIKPRLAPALYGVGLLEAVAETAIRGGDTTEVAGKSEEPTAHASQGTRVPGRFGWQGDSLSVRDQTTKAFAREMGLTSTDRPNDDCTPAEGDCLRMLDGASPEVSDDRLEAVVAFVRSLAVPQPEPPAQRASSGSKLFSDIGCGGCHRSRLPVQLPDATGTNVSAVIAPYTDLQLHDMGIDMADEDVSGHKVASRWRTAPLWGLGYRIKTGTNPTFLHDGRARSVEEAILWHAGEAARARLNFVNLGPRAREALLRWLEEL